LVSTVVVEGDPLISTLHVTSLPSALTSPLSARQNLLAVVAAPLTTTLPDNVAAVVSIADGSKVKTVGLLALMTIDSDRVTVALAASVTWTVNVNVPVVVGVPEINPEGTILKPPGKDPEVTLQEYEGAPPEASSC
jgi:hypothetical protein